MSTFRDVSSLPLDGIHSVTKGSVNSEHLRQSEACKCDDANTLTRHNAVNEQRNKISGLVKVNQQLLEENELMKQCIIRLMENADLRSTNALSLAMSQTDERLRKFITESIAGNTPKDKEATIQHRIEFTTPGRSRTKSTNVSKSYGTSFKEVRLSELNNNLTAMSPKDPKIINSHDYTRMTSNRHDSPNPASIQSYGKSFEEIKLSELADESYFPKSRDTAVDNKPVKVLQSKNDDDPSEFRSYGKSFKEINLSELNNDPPTPKTQKYNITSDFNSYGKSFKQISLRELGGNSDISSSSFRPVSAKKVRPKSPKITGSPLQHPNQNTISSHVVSQPPMKFGVGKSAYQKSPKSPVPQMHQTNSLSHETTNQSRVKKRRSRSRSQRLQTTGPYNLSKMPRRPRSTPLTRGNVQYTKSKRMASPNDVIQFSSKQNEPRVLLPALLKQILETKKEMVHSSIPNACLDCTNVPCTCHRNNSIDIVSKQMTNALGESFSHDSLDKTSGQQSNVPSSSVNDTAKDIKTTTQGNKRVSETPYAPKQLPTLSGIDSPIFTSTKVSKDDDKKHFPTSPRKVVEIGPESQREDRMTHVQTKPHPGISAVVREVFRSGVDALNVTPMHQDQSNLRKEQYSSIGDEVGETVEKILDRDSEELSDHIDITKVIQTIDGLPNQSKRQSGIKEVPDRLPVKEIINRKTDNSKFEEQLLSKNDRTEAASNVDQPTPIQNKDKVVQFNDDTLQQSANDGIGKPLAFSTPKSPSRPVHKEIISVIQTWEASINLETTSVAARDVTHEKQIKQSSVPRAGDSSNTVDNANDERSKDGIPNKELLLASMDSRNDDRMQTIDFLAKMMRFRGRAKVRYIVHRAVDTLLGYKPNLLIVASAIQAAGKPNKRLVGEISFQLDRRILEYVFDGVKDKMGKRRSRYYGYSVASILQLIDKEVRYANNDADLNRVLRNRLEDILKQLNSLGYKIEHHSEFAQDMVNQFGLLNGEPEPGSVEYLGMKEPAILRVVLGQTLHDDEDLDSMVVILDSLLYMAYYDHRPIFVW